MSDPMELVREGTISTLVDFAMLCARSIDHLHDVKFSEKLPDIILPRTDYWDSIIPQKEAKLAEMQAWTLAESKRAAERYYTQELAERQRRLRLLRAWTKNARAMRQKVRLWIPPTKEHRGLKDHMLHELGKWTVKIDKTLHPAPAKPGPDWYANTIAELIQTITRLTQDRHDEIVRATQATAWLQALRGSL